MKHTSNYTLWLSETQILHAGGFQAAASSFSVDMPYYRKERETPFCHTVSGATEAPAGCTVRRSVEVSESDEYETGWMLCAWDAHAYAHANHSPETQNNPFLA